MNVRLNWSRSALIFRGATICAGGCLFVMLAASDARAVVITGATYAANTGGPGTNPDTKTFSLTNPVTISDSIRSDVTYSHAQAWADATVTCAGVTKSTGGRGWVDTPPTATGPLYDNKSNLWNASASGTQVVANYTGTGSAPQFAPFHFVMPGGGVASQFNAFPGNGPTDPAAMAPPSSGQGFVVNGGGGGSGSLPSFFDVFMQVSASVQQGAAAPVSLFQGTLLFDPSTLQVQATGGFAGVNLTITPGSTPGQFFVSFPTIQGGTVDTVVGQPFNANFDVYMTMGDPNRQFGNPGFQPGTFDFSSKSGGPVGVAAGLATSVMVNDPSNFMVSTVPLAANSTWTGAGGVGNWTSAVNWLGGTPPAATNMLAFDGSNTLTNNDFPANTQFNGLTFAPMAGSFTLGGNALLLAGDINDNSPNAQTISLPLVFNGGTTNVNVASGGSLALGTLTFGAASQAGTFSALNVNNSVSATSLVVQTNNLVASTINIAAGATLNLTTGGANKAIVVVGTPATTPSPVTTSLTVSGGGTLNIGPTTDNFIVGVGSGNNNFGAFNATLDMSNLANFVYSGNGTAFFVGVGTRSQATLKLANTSNTITTSILDIGSTAPTAGGLQPPGGGDNASGFSSNLFLGTGTNTLNVSTLVIGSVQGSGSVQFLDSSLGSVVIQGVAAGTQANNIFVGNQTTGSAPGTSQLLLAGHNATVLASNMNVGQVNGSAGSSTGIVTFDTGTFSANTVTLALHSSGAGAASGTFIFGGPSPNSTATGVLNVTGAFSLANKTVNNTSLDSGTFTINGGTANINTDILDASTQGTRTTTLNLAGGTLNMMGHAIGSSSAAITNVNLLVGGGQATLMNLGGAGIATTANPGGGLLMNGSGQLNLAGVNIYNGPTIITSGTVSVIGSINGSSPVIVNGGALIGNGDGMTTGLMGPVIVNGGSVRAGTTPGDIGKLTMSNLTFNAGNLTADLGSGLSADLIRDTGPLTIGNNPASPLSLTVTGTQATGPYEIIDYAGPLIRNSDFIISGPLGFTFTLDYLTAPGKVFVDVATDPNVLIWNGPPGATTWDFVSPNFAKGGANVAYTDGMPVSFNDLTPGNATTINIAATVFPSIVSVACSVNNYTFSGPGVISGTAALMKDGTSTLTILNNNTYTGGTTINNGTILVGNGGTTGSLGPGTITNNGVLAYNRSDIVTLANTITGAGSVQKLGSGTLILTANNSYGATVISAGTMQIGNGSTTGSVGSGPITINAGGTLAFNRSDNVNLANTISGSGALSLAGPGTLTLSGANTLTGGVTVSQGGIYSTNFLPSGGAGGGHIFAASLPVGAIVLNPGTLQYTGTAVTSSDSITLGPASDTLDASGAANAALNLSNTGPIAFSSSTSPITLTLTGTSTGANTLAAAIPDPGTGPNVTTLVKNGPGTWLVSGADSYNGGTIVNGGKLRLIFTGGNVMVGSGATATVNNNATLEIANSTPALSVATITNNSTAAGLLISATCLEVGRIEGTGATQVNAGGGVTTDHIIQSALIIAGTGTNPGIVTIAASDPSGNPLAVTSGLALADSLSPSGPFASGLPGSSSLLSGDGLSASDSSGNRTSVDSLSGSTAAVPEPTTLLLALLGAASWGYLARRNRT